MATDLLLAVETSHLQGSVALADARGVLGERALAAQPRNAAALIPAIDELVRAAERRLADLAVCAYSCGPGSFTGLRVAATLAGMLQSVSGCRVVAVPTLAVIAENAAGQPEGPEHLAVMLDARRGEVFGGLFQRSDEGWSATSDVVVVEPAGWLAGLPQPLWVTGAGAAVHAAAVAAAGATALEESCWLPRAENVVVLGRRLASEGRFCAPEEIRPHYGRPPACEEVYEQRRAAARQRRGE
jgi:tRNA threonylcarbamoyladenosine biosynthesis protein TsaB